MGVADNCEKKVCIFFGNIGEKRGGCEGCAVSVVENRRDL